MVYIKMQLMCLMIVAYIGFLYLWERHRYHSSKISPYFAAILVSGRDFNPIIAQTFLELRPQVEKL